MIDTLLHKISRVLNAGFAFAVCSVCIAFAAESGEKDVSTPSPGNVSGETVLIGVNADGSLRYAPYTSRGDRIPDFSHCGYGAGVVAIPDVPVRLVLAPVAGDGDDTARIQAAIDRVSKMPVQQDGARGAVLLKKGAYRCAGVLQIHASGVVLKGEGDGEEGTVIVATTRKQQPLIRIGSREKTPVVTLGSTLRDVTDDYVPVGGCTVTVGNTRGLNVGQTIFVIRHGNREWISAIGMDRIKARPGNPSSTKQWKPFDLAFDRVITAIDGNRITFDAPIACAIDKKWGGGSLVCYRDAARIRNCGVENLRADSVYDPSVTGKGKRYPSDENHAVHLVSFGAVTHAWARRLTSVHFYNGPAIMENGSKWITVEDCRSLKPVSILTGGRRYPYHINGGQLCLVQRCYSDEARHAFVVGARVPGPNVFLDCRSEHDHGSSEPHHRWSVGGLYDNVKAGMAIQDRQWMGSGHGWAGANYVVWNCRGNLICEQPPTAQNLAIGFTGRRNRGAFNRTPGWWESQGTPVRPESLYKAQLAERLRRVKKST